jgi:hypothetical protein
MPNNSTDPLGLYCPVIPIGAPVTGIHCTPDAPGPLGGNGLGGAWGSSGGSFGASVSGFPCDSDFMPCGLSGSGMSLPCDLGYCGPDLNTEDYVSGPYANPYGDASYLFVVPVWGLLPTATIGVYHPSVATCLGQAGIAAAEDLLGLSMLPGSDQDNWQWSSDKFGFVYTGAGEGIESGIGIDAIENAADFVKDNPAAQETIRQFLRSEGAQVSLRHISQDATAIGKWAGRAGKVFAAYSAYERYEKCKGD